MRARSDRLQENALEHELTLLRRDLAEFTTRQPVSGASGILSYEARTTDQWDFTATVGLDSDGTSNTTRTTVITVTFTGDGSQQFPIENIFASLYVNGITLADQPTLRTDGVYIWSDTSGRSLRLIQWAVAENVYWGDPLRYSWTFQFQSLKQVTIYFKAFAGGSSPGTLSVTGVVT